MISNYVYDYDTNGNRTSQTEVNGTTETTAYTYDTLDRMANFLVTGNTGSTKTEYTFEGYNRKTEKVMINGTVTANKTYTYDETDWLAKVQDSVGPRTVSYSYDNNGNTISKTDTQNPSENKAFEYDSLNRLVQAKGSTGNVLGLYDYNSQGMRSRHRNSERGDVDYFYDGRSVIEEHAADSSFLARYQYGDRLIAMNALGGTQYYLQDGLGSSVNMTDTAGKAIVTYNLDPWGTVKNQTGYSFNTHIFTGKEFDGNTGLIYFGARYYDSNTARFTTQDTYLGEQGTPPSLHRYLYAYSNPTVYVDLFGYEAENEFALIPRFSKYGYDDNVATNIAKIPYNAAASVINEGIDILNVIPYNVQYATKYGLSKWSASSVDANAAEVKAIASGVKNAVVETVTKPQETIEGVGQAFLSAENWENVATVGGAALLGKVTGKSFKVQTSKRVVLTEESAAGQEAISGATSEKTTVNAISNQSVPDRVVLSGHGAFVEGSGSAMVPEGTSLTVWTEHGKTITDKLGNYIELGKPINFAEFGEEVAGAKSYLPGAKVPNYTLFPPEGLNIVGNPITVQAPTPLATLLEENMGNVNWAACQECIHLPKK